MLSDLKFLTAAVARKDFVEELCHFVIHDGWARSFDGIMSMQTSFDNMNLSVRPHAREFIKAIAACDEEKNTIGMHVTPTGRLSVQSGKFKAFVPCLDPTKEAAPIPKPEGLEFEVSEKLLKAITDLAPFMSIDASRPWSQGIRLAGDSAYATNNIVLVQRFSGTVFPFEIIVPAEFVKTIAKIDQKPVIAQVSESSLSFFYANKRWIRTQLVVGQWPENLENVFKNSATAKPLPDDFFTALDALKPFMDDRGRVYIYPDRLATSNVPDEGASVDVDTGISGGQLFHLEYLRMLQPMITKADFEQYPAPCPWFGEELRGMIVGQRQ